MAMAANRGGRGGVDACEYELMAATENHMRWFCAARALMLWAFRAVDPPQGPVLDAGCGTGGLLGGLTGVAPERLRIGMDHAPVALAHARQKETARAVSGSVDRLPFADGSLASIISADVLCHAGVDQRAPLAESTRRLMTGGVLILNPPAYDWLKSAHDRRVHNARRYVRHHVEALLDQSGLRLRRATHGNAALLLPMAAWRLLSGGRAAASDVKEYPWLVDRAFGLLLTAERWCIRRGLDLPFAGSILAAAVKP